MEDILFIYPPTSTHMREALLQRGRPRRIRNNLARESADARLWLSRLGGLTTALASVVVIAFISAVSVHLPSPNWLN